MLSDSAISLDLFRDDDDDDDLPDLDSYSFVEAKDGVGIPPTSPQSCSGVGDELMKSGPSSSSKSLGKLGKINGTAAYWLAALLYNITCVITFKFSS